MFYRFVSVLPPLPKYYSGVNKQGSDNYTYRKRPINIEVLYNFIEILHSFITYYSIFLSD